MRSPHTPHPPIIEKISSIIRQKRLLVKTVPSQIQAERVKIRGTVAQSEALTLLVDAAQALGEI